MDDYNIMLETLSQNIKTLRTINGYTTRQVAEAIHCSPSTILNWEKGKMPPDSIALQVLSRFYSVTPDELLGWRPCKVIEDFERKNLELVKTLETLKDQKRQLERQIKEYSSQLSRN